MMTMTMMMMMMVTAGLTTEQTPLHPLVAHLKSTHTKFFFFGKKLLISKNSITHVL